MSNYVGDVITFIIASLSRENIDQVTFFLIMSNYYLTGVVVYVRKVEPFPHIPM